VEDVGVGCGVGDGWFAGGILGKGGLAAEV
jgi:hypothetical protein